MLALLFEVIAAAAPWRTGLWRLNFQLIIANVFKQRERLWQGALLMSRKQKCLHATEIRLTREAFPWHRSFVEFVARLALRLLIGAQDKRSHTTQRDHMQRC